MPRDLVDALQIWATALGTQGPEWHDDWEVAIVDTVVRDASRAAARATIEHAGADRAAALARLLLPAAGDRPVAAVLSALGYRTLGKLVRTVDAGEDQAQLVHEYEAWRGIGYDEDHLAGTRPRATRLRRSIGEGVP